MIIYPKSVMRFTLVVFVSLSILTMALGNTNIRWLTGEFDASSATGIANLWGLPHSVTDANAPLLNTEAVNGKIVFSSNRDGLHQIYVMNADGTGQVNVSNSAFLDDDPSFSRDGRKIVFSRRHETSVPQGMNNEIYVMDADGSNQVRLTDNQYNDEQPSFSADGTQITFYSARDGDAEIYRMNSDGSGQTRLTTASGLDQYPSFSPDGTRIAFSSFRDGNVEIYIMNANGSGQTRLTNNSPVTDDVPSFSPDGTKILFVSSRSGHLELHTMSLTGTNVTRLTNDGTFKWGPSFSPDGSKIVYQSANSTISVVNADGSNRVQLLNGLAYWASWGGVPSDPAVTSQNGKIVFESSRDGNPEIYTMNADGSDVVRLTNNSASDTEPAFSPDGSQIVFASRRDSGGFSEIYIMNSDGTGQTRLTNNAGADAFPGFSPDGHKIIFTSTRNFNMDLYTMNLQGGDLTRLTTAAEMDAYGSYSPDGLKVVFMSYRDGSHPEIYTMNADGTGQTRITNNSATDTLPMFSADASRIVFCRDGLNGSAFEILTMNADGSDVLRLTNTAAYDQSPSYSPDGTKILFTTNRDGNFEIYTMDLNGGDQTRITNTADDEVNPRFQAIATSAPSPSPTPIPTLTPSPSPSPIPTPNPTPGPQSCDTLPVIYAYDFSNDHLVSFNASTPGTLISDIPLIGLDASDYLLGIDVRPGTGGVYAVTSSYRLVTIDASTGVITYVGGATTSAPDLFVGFDVDPVTDQIRIVGTSRSNRRFDPGTGGLIASDTALAYPAGDPGFGTATNVAHIAYDRPGPTASTTLFGIDSVTDTLVRIGGVDGSPSANSGQLTTVGSLGVSTASFGGFDIQGGSERAYAVLRMSGVSVLHTINLVTGVATPIGPVAGGGVIDGITMGACIASPTPTPTPTPTPSISPTPTPDPAVVTNTNDSGDGSLRAAIEYANSAPDQSSISFNIPGTGLHSIALTSGLPVLTSPATIDGTTQPGYAGTPIIEINGAASVSHGLDIASTGCVVKGFVINRFAYMGINVAGNGSGAQILENYIGTDASGTAALPNGGGVSLSTGSNILRNNVISGNRDIGLVITSQTTDGNVVAGNLIGTNADGTGPLGSQPAGINVYGSLNNTIGGATPADRNVISGNVLINVVVMQNAAGNSVLGNYIGTNAAGTASIGPQGPGLLVSNGATGTNVGSASASGRNVISGNGGSTHGGIGIELRDSATTGNQVLGNYIGTDASGMSAIPNAEIGLAVSASPNNVIGGTEPGAGNVISGNGGGLVIRGTAATGNQVLGNFIGLDAFGTACLGNQAQGVFIYEASDNLIGGTQVGSRNIVSCNRYANVEIKQGLSTGNLVIGNYLGTDLTGSAALQSPAYGVSIGNGAASNRVGGSTPAERNVISGHDGCGVSINSGGDSNSVLGNFIGTNAAGMSAVPNKACGVVIDAASHNTVGGVDVGTGNLISGNLSFGAIIQNGASENVLSGNTIGRNVSNTSALPNNGGVYVTGASLNLVGGAAPAAGNIISSNSGAGVIVDCTLSGGTATCSQDNSVMYNQIIANSSHGVIVNGAINTGIAVNTITQNVVGVRVTCVTYPAGVPNCSTGTGIHRNSIFSNSSMGIQFVGPVNQGQLPPILSSAYVKNGSTARLQGQANSAPGALLTIFFYSNSTCDGSGAGEGQNYLGSVFATADSAGVAQFSFIANASQGQVITATATAPGNNTSSFSQCREVVSPPAPVLTPTVTGTMGNNGWYTGDVGISWSISDPDLVSSSSGCTVSSVTSDTAAATFTCTATNSGGTTTQSVTAKRDSTPPAIACALADGLWHAADVSRPCTAADIMSGVANPVSDSAFTLVTSTVAGTETNDAQTGSRQICDIAGNCEIAGPLGGNMIDKKAPVFFINAPQDGATYYKKQSLTASYSCVDAGSGAGGCIGTVPVGSPVDTSTPGTITFTVSGSDAVGNTASRTITYTVVNNAPPGVPSSDLEVSIVDDAPSSGIVAGTNITYTITATNNGPDPVFDLMISDTMPPGTSFVSADVTNGSMPFPGGTSGTIAQQSWGIPVGGTVTLHVVLKAWVPKSTIENIVKVQTWYGFDPKTSNNSASTKIRVR